MKNAGLVDMDRPGDISLIQYTMRTPQTAPPPTPPASPGTRRTRLSRTAWALAAFVWWLAASLGHDAVSTTYGHVFKLFGRQAMESGLHVGSLALAVAGLGVLAWRLRTRRRVGTNTQPRILVATEWLLVAALLWGCDALLISTNVERVHYPQYALLALLLRAAVGGDFLALALCTAGGVVDEWLQYVMYPHYTQYLDFNDFLLNLAGAALGLALARQIARVAPLPRPDPDAVSRRVARLAIRLGTTIAAVFAWLLTTGRVISFLTVPSGAKPATAFPRVGDATVLVLSYVSPESFWSVTGFGRRYHILAPVEGVAALACCLLTLWWVYLLMARNARR